jgi:hypothetical protein
MPIEEITLLVPGGPPAQLDQASEHRPGSPVSVTQPAVVSELVVAYLKSIRARDRFAFTHRGRTRNRDRFDQSLKAIVKKLATDSATPVDSRSARMRVRAQVYGDTMELIRAMSVDQLRMVKRSRTYLRWSLVTAGVGLAMIAWTLTINDIITLPIGKL